MPKDFEQLVYLVPADQVDAFVLSNSRTSPDAILLSKKPNKASSKVTGRKDRIATNVEPITRTVTWHEELAGLQNIVRTVNEAVEAENAVALYGFNKLYERVTKLGSTGRALYSRGELRFRSRVVELIAKSVAVYSKQEERPGHIGGKRRATFIYNRTPNLLTPREVRALVEGLGLAGKIVDGEIIAAREGIVDGNQTIQQAITHLIWALRDKDENAEFKALSDEVNGGEHGTSRVDPF